MSGLLNNLAAESSNILETLGIIAAVIVLVVAVAIILSQFLKKTVVGKLASSIRQYKKQTILTPLFMVGEVIFELIVPLLMSKMVLEYLTELSEPTGDTWSLVMFNTKIVELSTVSPDFGYLVICGLILILCGVMSFLFGSLSGIFCARASAGFAGNLRHDLYYSVQNFSFSNIDKFSSSSLVTRLTTDVTNVQNAFMTIIRMGVRAPLMMICSFTFSLGTFKTIGQAQLNSMTVVYLIVVPVLLVGLGSLMAIAMPMFNRIFKRYDALNESVQENVKGMRVVKAYVREDFEKEKFGKASERVKKDFTKAEIILAFNNPLMMIAMYATQIAVFFICGRFGIIEGNSEIISKLQMLVSYSMSALMSFMMLSMVFVMITLAYASAKRICEVLDEKSDIVNPENPITEVKDGSVDFDGVSFKYSKKAEEYALSDIDLHIAPGETVGIIGSTGSSKTSLVNLIPRLYDATRGTVKVGGVNVKEYDLKTLRDSVAVVLQKNLLFSGTIAENIRWGNKDASDEEVERVCKLAQADDFIRSFPEGYNSRIEQGGTNVSGGQKQRLCIARALIKKPAILILDDSTSAVDTHTDALIRKAFAEEIPDTTKIIIAQRVASVQDADKIIVMDGGKINGMGSHEELLATNAIYQEVYKTQNRVNEGGEE